ncbi:MAG: PDZ domain-containing protein, partial [Kiloniellaceae bacterium]
ALVASVTEGGPAERAGIEQGDVILTFNGRPVSDMRRLPRMVAETPIGQKVKVEVWRKGEKRTFAIELGELDDERIAKAESGSAPKAGAEAAVVSALGLDLSRLTPELRQRFSLSEDAEGVVIKDIDQAGSAAEKGLRPGDVIVEVDQEQVKTPGDVAARVKKARDEGYRVVTLLVLREGDFQWVAVRIDEG